MTANKERNHFKLAQEFPDSTILSIHLFFHLFIRYPSKPQLLKVVHLNSLKTLTEVHLIFQFLKIIE